LNDVRQMPPQPTPVAMETKFLHKIDCNSACVRDIAEILAPIRGFEGRAIE